MLRMDLIELLADGEVHSGTVLAECLACSRTAIWKQVQALVAVDLPIEALPGRGYRLTRSLELLDRRRIRGQLRPQVRAALDTFDIHAVTTSTSEALRGDSPAAPGRLRVVLAEYQSGGRGRRGRRWLSPFASGICLSVGWTFPVLPANLSALSLAAGLAVFRALSIFRPAGLGLKWPNDVMAGGGKLGGLLIDVQGETAGPVAVVVGVGINIDATDVFEREVVANGSLAPIGLRSLVGDGVVSRNRLAAALIDALSAMLQDFQAAGFAGFVDDWRRVDCMTGRPVTVQVGNQTHSGIVAGITDDGALLLNVAGQVRSFVSGEVTVRPQAENSAA